MKKILLITLILIVSVGYSQTQVNSMDSMRVCLKQRHNVDVIKTVVSDTSDYIITKSINRTFSCSVDSCSKFYVADVIQKKRGIREIPNLEN